LSFSFASAAAATVIATALSLNSLSSSSRQTTFLFAAIPARIPPPKNDHNIDFRMSLML